jgi:tRNA pseudouridine55 synthase
MTDPALYDDKILLLDKPYRWSSFDMVNKVRVMLRYETGKKFKIGHAGTLDPLATGLLILCLGKRTKQISEIQELKKEYVATFRFGATTPCFDLEKEVDQEYPWDHITEDVIKAALQQFTGPQNQEPPLFSAVQVDGKRAYKYARKGEDIKLAAKPIIIYTNEFIEYNPPFLTARIVCSKGTYIRALARDLGEHLGSGAHLTALRRTKIGDYCVENAYTKESLESELKAAGFKTED